MPRARRQQGEPGDPALALFDVLGQRWALRVLWELRDDPLTYRAIANRIPGLSTSVLTTRLRELRAASLVEHEARSGYRLSPDGRSLLNQLTALAEWARQANFTAPRRRS
ncbi:MAG: transcriptional regulator [Streptosporangiales bacterium]|nr:transcriptional regulator [Streptosporangiales bacterium]